MLHFSQQEYKKKGIKMTIANKGTYLPDVNDKRLFGLDLSSNQGVIDFNMMANPVGFPPNDFIACRTGISWAYKDSWFETYWKKIKEKTPNVKRYAYHVLYPGESIKAQVDNMASRFPNKQFDGDAVVNDLELDHGLSRGRISEACYEFTNRLQDWAKKPALIYSRFSWVEAFMDITTSRYIDWYAKQLWWMANYYGRNWLGIPILAEFPTESMYKPKSLEYFDVVIHQTGEKGDGKKVGTTSNQVDTNRWTQSTDRFYNLFGYTEIPDEPAIPDEEKLDRLWNAHPELH